jgi:EAL domain-containing protein (putative c-di-GMP-specific phosphodiesterase class I)
MGLPTVAEGIEDRSQLELLRDMGCSHGQGYLFGRPIPLRARIVIPQQKPPKLADMEIAATGQISDRPVQSLVRRSR